MGTGSKMQSHGFLLPFVHITSSKELYTLKEGRSRVMNIQMEGQPEDASVPALAAYCMREINNYRRGETNDTHYCLELLHRAKEQHDDVAMEVLRQCFSEVARGWIRRHPQKEAMSRSGGEEYYLARTFERFWQVVIQQGPEFSTLATALRYLQASLNGVLLDTLRAYSPSNHVSLSELDDAGEQVVESNKNGNELWETIQGMLPGEREQRVANLLFHYGLQPEEIVRDYPQEFSYVQEIARLRRSIIAQLVRLESNLLEQ